jgi:hypothetical protein
VRFVDERCCCDIGVMRDFGGYWKVYYRLWVFGKRWSSGGVGGRVDGRRSY